MNDGALKDALKRRKGKVLTISIEMGKPGEEEMKPEELGLAPDGAEPPEEREEVMEEGMSPEMLAMQDQEPVGDKKGIVEKFKEELMRLKKNK